MEGKLDAGIARMNELNKLAQKERPDVLVSLSSPEAARVAFGLKIPHICVNDIPESEAVTKLTAPLSTLIVAPLLIPKSAWLKYGVPAEKVRNRELGGEERSFYAKESWDTEVKTSLVSRTSTSKISSTNPRMFRLHAS